jgi:hypothetical protein|tara:strand:+ start:263 stop:442 length:180 start_codon:yes stop_codon:yes gene_type:complete
MYYAHKIKPIDELINELWQHEINYLTLDILTDMANKQFVQDVKRQSDETIRRHHRKTIG